MSGVLSIGDRERLAKICGLFGSDLPGERSSAAYKAHRFLLSKGVDWFDALAPRQSEGLAWEWNGALSPRVAVKCLAWSVALNDWEISFLRSVSSWPTLKGDQPEKLRVICEKVETYVRAGGQPGRA